MHGYLCGIYSSQKLEAAYQYRVDFIWLRGNAPVPAHSTFARFRTGLCTVVMEDLFYQYIRLLEKFGENDHEAVFVDGTKLESRAGRYCLSCYYIFAPGSWQPATGEGHLIA